MNILHLEDSAPDAELIAAVLRREWPTCSIRLVATAPEYRSALAKERFDVILSDYSLPGFDGLLALSHARRTCPEVPFVFLSGTIGEERAVEALKLGAADYIIKDRPNRLVPAIRHAVALVTETERRQHFEEALHENHERFRLITEAVGEQICVLDLAGRRTYSNAADRKKLARAAAEVPTDWFQDVHRDDVTRVRRVFDQLVQTGRSECFDFRWQYPDGSIHYAEAQGGVLRNGHGAITHVVIVSRDVTARRAAEARVRDQAALLDKARDAIIATDLEHRITYWNASAERLYGLGAAEVIGRRFDELGLGFDAARFTAARGEVLTKGEWRGEFQLRTARGESVVVDSTWSLVDQDDGSARCILAIDTDVTARKKLEAQLLRAQRMESIGTLAGGIAHDLNNVFTPILLTIDLFTHRITAPDERTLVEQTRASTLHGAGLVRQLLAFARGADGERASVEPATAIAAVEPLLRQCLPPSVTLEITAAPDVWPMEANRTQLNQVLINLVLNARDAMPQGGRITLAMENAFVDAALAAANPGTRPGPFVRIAVRDNGVGIPPAIVDRIFDPFFTTKTAGKGSGLGLATVAGILKSHGGLVQVESEVGVGTMFQLFFPAQQTAPAAPAVPVAPAANAPTQSVLLVDDEPAVRETLRLLLQRAGYTTIPAADTRSALREFEQHEDEIGLVITDMMLPDGSGLDIVRKVRARKPTLPMIAISGMMGSGNFDELHDFSPPVECLAKPLPPRTLLNAASRALHPLGNLASPHAAAV